MNATTRRIDLLALAAIAGAMLLPAAGPSKVLQPDKVVILSTTDVKGKTSPCGCHTPKGGFSRRATYIDSTKAQYGQVLVVDNGGFFPEPANQTDVAWFVMDAMKLLGTDASNVGERDLRYGLAFLKGQQKRSGLTLVSSNLVDAKAGKPVFQPYVIQTVGKVKVGVLGLISDKVDLGPARDSLTALEPAVTAEKTIAEMKKKGAQAIVLLSQLGKVETEDLVTAVSGADVAIVGREVPLLQQGRIIKNTIACYGGHEGQYLGRTVLTLDAKGAVVTRENDMSMLGPAIAEDPEVLALVKNFEDSRNERLRRDEAKAAVTREEKREDAPDRFLGSEVCMRCHVAEGEQWQTTSHSVAWQTLINVKKDATPDCVGCHVVGFRKPTGFETSTATPHLSNVQCENCHGIGTQHEALAANPKPVTEQVCIQCHRDEHDPEWNWEKKLPMIAHHNFSRETIKNKKNKMGGASGH
jgi:2',3'-cyclic-nucleotide 2'-phosphodiesterase (5'-nucleotidase family)